MSLTKLIQKLGKGILLLVGLRWMIHDCAEGMGKRKSNATGAAASAPLRLISEHLLAQLGCVEKGYHRWECSDGGGLVGSLCVSEALQVYVLDACYDGLDLNCVSCPEVPTAGPVAGSSTVVEPTTEGLVGHTDRTIVHLDAQELDKLAGKGMHRQTLTPNVVVKTGSVTMSPTEWAVTEDGVTRKVVITTASPNLKDYDMPGDGRGLKLGVDYFAGDGLVQEKVAPESLEPLRDINAEFRYKAAVPPTIAVAPKARPPTSKAHQLQPTLTVHIVNNAAGESSSGWRTLGWVCLAVFGLGLILSAFWIMKKIRECCRKVAGMGECLLTCGRGLGAALSWAGSGLGSVVDTACDALGRGLRWLACCCTFSADDDDTAAFGDLVGQNHAEHAASAVVEEPVDSRKEKGKKHKPRHSMSLRTKKVKDEPQDDEM